MILDFGQLGMVGGVIVFPVEGPVNRQPREEVLETITLYGSATGTAVTVTGEADRPEP